MLKVERDREANERTKNVRVKLLDFVSSLFTNLHAARNRISSEDQGVMHAEETILFESGSSIRDSNYTIRRDAFRKT